MYISQTLPISEKLLQFQKYLSLKLNFPFFTILLGENYI